MVPKVMSPALLDELSDRFKALGEPARLQLLAALRGGERSVTELVEATGLGQANVSKHLSKMRASGVLASRRDGTSIYYRVIDPAAFTICRTVCDALEQRAETEHRLLKSVALAARKASK